MTTTGRHLIPFVALEAATALSGAPNGVSMVAFPWLVLELTGRGRVLGLSTSIAYAAGPAGYLLVGPLIDKVGLRGTFLLLAGGLVVVAVASLAVRGFKGLDDVPDGDVGRLDP